MHNLNVPVNAFLFVIGNKTNYSTLAFEWYAVHVCRSWVIINDCLVKPAVSWVSIGSAQLFVNSGPGYNVLNWCCLYFLSCLAFSLSFILFSTWLKKGRNQRNCQMFLVVRTNYVCIEWHSTMGHSGYLGGGGGLASVKWFALFFSKIVLSLLNVLVFPSCL